jgi:hypothetical protein
MKDYYENKIDVMACDRRCVVSFVAGALFLLAVLWFTKPDLPSPGIGANAALRSAEREALACVRTLEVTQKSADFWREQALSMRTDGVDSTKPVNE